MAIRIQEHSPWKSQVLVIKALLKRELITRFGKYKLGAIWILTDPLLSVLYLGLILGPFMSRSTGEIPYIFFILCGFMLLNTCTGCISAGISAISANQGLLVFKKVQPIDPYVARFFFQLCINGFALAFFCVVAYWLGLVISLERIPQAIACVLITWLIGSGFGLHVGIASTKFKEVEKIAAYMPRPLLFFSCVLHPLNGLPPEIQTILLYNPLVHTIESLRINFFPGYHAEGVNLYYPLAWALCCCAFGLMSYRNNRHFLTQR
ncbi:MAG: ABC transporter permease [Akkermansiaceae bacterium]